MQETCIIHKPNAILCIETDLFLCFSFFLQSRFCTSWFVCNGTVFQINYVYSHYWYCIFSLCLCSFRWTWTFIVVGSTTLSFSVYLWIEGYVHRSTIIVFSFSVPLTRTYRHPDHHNQQINNKNVIIKK
jgi:hypothetical protein